ncbi:hypothetical protein J8Z28_20470 [Pseudoalteromonas sp. SCSIO 43088]|uniref:hypothetical protein n=1 Tax=Pseudoalteromonas sp. SCSIO 43088 TaxID=2822846 RepID=UPI00202B3DD1|nr:hypothetical protein [Pseudoalteromonas sp. SCSIO 43088]URQ88263.1 hypothetical protein J8Z28_20470 [Pseudoalteromonas sp. SCSIO 43088]
MASPDKPKTPLSEKLQVNLATEMFEKGSTIKDGVRDDFLASHRRDERGQAMSRVGAESAKASLNRLKKARRSGSTKTVSSSVDVTSAGISATGKGGRSYNTEGDIVRRDTSSTERVARSMARIDNDESMSEFVEDNKKKQAVMDLGMSAVTAAMYAKDEADRREAAQERRIADQTRAETRVDPYSSMSAMNYDSTGMGA